MMRLSGVQFWISSDTPHKGLHIQYLEGLILLHLQLFCVDIYSVGGLKSQAGCIPVLTTTSVFFYYHLPPALTLYVCMPHFPVRLAQRKRFTVIYEGEVHLLMLLPGLSSPMLTMNVSLQAFQVFYLHGHHLLQAAGLRAFLPAVHKLRPPYGCPACGHEQRHLEEAEGCLTSLPHSRGGRSSTTLVWTDLGASHCTQVERRAWLWTPSGEWARKEVGALTQSFCFDI